MKWTIGISAVLIAGLFAGVFWFSPGGVGYSREQVALLEAIHSRDLSGVQTALQDGVDFNCDRDGTSALCMLLLNARSDSARQQAWLAAADAAVKSGADINRRDALGRTILFRWWDKRELDWLIAHGADVRAKDKDGRNPLHADAADVGLSIETFIALGLSPNAPDNSGMTPLHVAAEEGNALACQILIAHGAEPDLRDSRGRSALDIARTSLHRDAELAMMAGR